ncbi:MAG: tripartite tricarboxylate transporter substrate binding protein [Dehalococcoidia bacterium]
MKGLLTLVVLALALLLVAGACAAQRTPRAGPFEPSKPVAFVITTDPGGGSDVYARTWTAVIEELGLSPQPFVPLNKAGGAGAIALSFLWEQRGDPHFLTPTLNSVITTPMVQVIPVRFPSEDLTPLVLMAIDPFLLWSNPNTFANWDEFQAACQQRSLTVGGTGPRQEDTIQFAILEQAAGCQPMDYVPFPGGGTVAKNVAAQDIDASVNQPSEGLPHYPDRMVPLVAFASERLEVFPDVPTHYEVGLSGEFADLLSLESGLHQHRGLLGPPGLSEEALEWYEDVFRQVFDSQRWQDFMANKAMVPTFKGPAEYKEFLRDYQRGHLRVMRDVLGWELRDDFTSPP